MRHNLKTIAQNFSLPLRGFIEFALASPNQYGIDEENGIVTTSTFFTDLLVRDFRAEYLPRIGDTFFDSRYKNAIQLEFRRLQALRYILENNLFGKLCQLDRVF